MSTSRIARPRRPSNSGIRSDGERVTGLVAGGVIGSIIGAAVRRYGQSLRHGYCNEEVKTAGGSPSGLTPEVFQQSFDREIRDLSAIAGRQHRLSYDFFNVFTGRD